jgi:hypothetical protein
MQPPPSRDLRAQLRAAQEAAMANDRETFKATLAGIKSTLANYPPGAERDAASDAVNVFNDLERLWDFQFESPTGSFFDETSPFRAAMARYRGYEDAVRRQLITDATGTKFYPTRETKDFLMREAAQRLSRLGLAAPAPRVQPPVPAPAPRREVTPTPTPTRAEKPRVTTTTVRKPTRPSASQTPSTVRRKVAETPRHPQPQPPSRPAPAPQPVAPIDITPAPPIVATSPPSPAPTDTGVVASTTTATDSDTIATTQPSTETAATTTTAAPAAEKKGRNIILPVMLILIGVGVLIVLFRTSA